MGDEHANADAIDCDRLPRDDPRVAVRHGNALPRHGADGAPYADVDVVYYHLGYHVLIAMLARLTGFTVEQVMLVVGQVLNAALQSSTVADPQVGQCVTQAMRRWTFRGS